MGGINKKSFSRSELRIQSVWLGSYCIFCFVFLIHGWFWKNWAGRAYGAHGAVALVPVEGQGSQPHERAGLSLPVQSQLQPPLHLRGCSGTAGQGDLPAEHEAAAGVL